MYVLLFLPSIAHPPLNADFSPTHSFPSDIRGEDASFVDQPFLSLSNFHTANFFQYQQWSLLISLLRSRRRRVRTLCTSQRRCMRIGCDKNFYSSKIKRWRKQEEIDTI